MNPEARILFFADTHLGFDFPLKPRVERRHRGQGFSDNFRRILDYAERTRPDLVVYGGDLFLRSRVPPESWGVYELKFLPLPTRPMVDIPIDPTTYLADLRAYLVDKTTILHEDTVVRLKSKGEPDERLRGKLTASFLRSVFPQSVCVLLGREFY